MKKTFLIVFLTLAGMSFNSNASVVGTSTHVSVNKTSVYLGTVTQGDDVIELYGDAGTGIVDAVIFLQSSWPGAQVSLLQNVKVISGIATGKIYLDIEGSQAIIVLRNAPIN